MQPILKLITVSLIATLCRSDQLTNIFRYLRGLDKIIGRGDFQLTRIGDQYRLIPVRDIRPSLTAQTLSPPNLSSLPLALSQTQTSEPTIINKSLLDIESTEKLSSDSPSNFESPAVSSTTSEPSVQKSNPRSSEQIYALWANFIVSKQQLNESEYWSPKKRLQIWNEFVWNQLLPNELEPYLTKDQLFKYWRTFLANHRLPDLSSYSPRTIFFYFYELWNTFLALHKLTQSSTTSTTTTPKPTLISSQIRSDTTKSLANIQNNRLLSATTTNSLNQFSSFPQNWWQQNSSAQIKSFTESYPLKIYINPKPAHEEISTTRPSLASASVDSLGLTHYNLWLSNLKSRPLSTLLTDERLYKWWLDFVLSNNLLNSTYSVISHSSLAQMWSNFVRSQPSILSRLNTPPLVYGELNRYWSEFIKTIETANLELSRVDGLKAVETVAGDPINDRSSDEIRALRNVYLALNQNS